jgi:acetyltransferase-like isoleucine patch superfamily enzyme
MFSIVNVILIIDPYYPMSNVVQYVSAKARIGRNVRIWHFTYVGDGAEIGDDTRVGSLVHIDYGVRIGAGCKIEGMAYIPPLTRIGDRVFVGPGVVFTNDPYPMSEKMVGVTVEDDAIVCAGAVLRPGITVGARSVVGMGAVVTQDVPPDSVVYGNPARARYSRDVYLRKKAEWEKKS